VLTLSTRPSLAAEALASYTVKASLEAPFELADLLAAVRDALREPPLAAVVPEAATDAEVPAGVALAARLLARHSRAALFRWVLRLRREEPWASRADLHLARLLDSAPAVVETVVAALRSGETGRVFEEHPEVLARVRSYAQTRQQQGIPLAAVVRESHYLRDELWAILRPTPPSLTAADVLQVEHAVDATFDRVIGTTIDVYTESTAAGTERLAGT
jgi:hypothetical protein